MDFRLPFPTLKHLTMVCIGKVTLDKEIRPLQKLQEVHYDDNDDDEDDENDDNHIYKFEVEKIVTPLEIPATLKHDLSDVITGMFRQIESSFLLDYCEEFQCHERLEQRQLLFDVHGKLDQPTIWKRFFDNELSEIDSLDPLLDLLNFTIQQQLWYGLDAIVSKILSVIRPNADAFFKKRRLVELRGGFREQYAFEYCFNNSRTATRCLSQLQSLFHRHEKVTVSRDALHVCLPSNFRYHLNYQFFSDYFHRVQRSMNERGKITFISKLLSKQSLNLECLIDILKTLDHKTQRQCFAVVSQLLPQLPEFDNSFYIMLDRFLEWPFTHFFVPFLEFALPNICTHDVFINFFGSIKRSIPYSGRFGVLYADLLTKYWQAIPPEVKEEFRDPSFDMGCCNHLEVFKWSMEMLAETNADLSESILAEMGLAG